MTHLPNFILTAETIDPAGSLVVLRGPPHETGPLGGSSEKVPSSALVSTYTRGPETRHPLRLLTRSPRLPPNGAPA